MLESANPMNKPQCLRSHDTHTSHKRGDSTASDLYDPVAKTWHSTGEGTGVPALAPSWIDAGARLVGACCRTRPTQIRQLAHAVRP